MRAFTTICALAMVLVSQYKKLSYFVTVDISVKENYDI